MRERALDAVVSRLEARADVQAALKAGRKPGGSGGKPGHADDDGVPLMKDKYGSSLELMQHTYNNPRMPPALRFEAAKQALPYEHGKVGEVGKKQQRQDKAESVAGKRGPGRPPKFAPRKPPALRVVGGGSR